MGTRTTPLLVILGNQLFAPALLPATRLPVFVAEDVGLCTHFRYHKHKLVLFLAAMRSYAAGLRAAGWAVDYRALDDRDGDQPYEARLADAVARNGVERVVTFEVEDKFFEDRLRTFCAERRLDWEVLPTPMFLTSRDDFRDYLRSTPKPFMRTFYERQRRNLKLLMDDRGQPVGGRFSLDEENRKPLPKTVDPPEPWLPERSADVLAVSRIIDERFADHPGDTATFWIPTTRKDALRWLRDFLAQRFHDFGPYEDAIPARSTFVFHSALSPLLNLGLLTPAEVVKAAVTHAEKYSVPLASLEGFVRQIVGWREFVRGIYQHYSEREEFANFWNHTNDLSDMWYRGGSGIPPLDNAIAKVNRYGWCHHIERLMVLGNLMQLCGIAPKAAHRWFMEMFVDSSDWVMGPNVYGMGLFSDGGLFATKPYLCGSNYLRKMSGAPAGEWCDVVDGLYWSFVDRHRDYFDRNPRTPYLTRNFDKLDAVRRDRLFGLARDFRRRATVVPQTVG